MTGQEFDVVGVFAGNGDGTLSGADLYGWTGGPPSLVDLNGDGRVDIVGPFAFMPNVGDESTPVLVQMFLIECRESTVFVTLRVSGLESGTIRVERSPAGMGAWVDISGSIQTSEPGVISDVVPAPGSYDYRIVALHGGTSVPISEVRTILVSPHGGSARFLMEGANPAHGPVSFLVDLPVGTQATITVLDLLGREVARLVHGRLDSGITRLTWGQPARPGVYFAVLRTAELTRSVRFVLAR